MPKYSNTITGEIVEYPEEAAELFDVLRRVPSERHTTVVEVSDENREAPTDVAVELTPADPKDGNRLAK